MMLNRVKGINIIETTLNSIIKTVIQVNEIQTSQLNFVTASNVIKLF